MQTWDLEMLLFSRSVMSDSCDPRDCHPPGSSVHGIFQAWTLEWVAISFSRGSSQPRDWTHVSCIAGRFFTAEPPGKPSSELPAQISSSWWSWLCSVLDPGLGRSLPPRWGGVDSLALSSWVLAPHFCLQLPQTRGQSSEATLGTVPALGFGGLGIRGYAMHSMNFFSFCLLADLLLLTGLALSMFILSELFKLCEKFCCRAQKAQTPQEGV